MPSVNESAANSSQPAVDKLFIREAIDCANLNALRLALYQVTGDPELAKMRIEKEPIRGGAQFGYVLAKEDHAALKAKAFAYLGALPGDVPPPPSREEARHQIEMFGNEPVTDAELGFAYEELGFEAFPRDVQWTAKPSEDEVSQYKVIVVGAGISGIAAAIQFRRLGIPVTIIERQAGIGGTWLLNQYPEVRVDTPSYLYQFKFEKNYAWSELYPSGQETRRYLEHIVEKHGIGDAFQFDRDVIGAVWNEESATWMVTTRHRDGTVESMSANVVVSASGLFSTPSLPDIPGIGDFGGAIFHTAAWDHGVDYHGKRAALIGTGSTGTQLTPGLAREVAHLSIYQRTPSWIMATANYREPVSPHMRWMMDTMPYYWNWYCYAVYFAGLQLQGLQEYDRAWQANGGIINQRNDLVRNNLIEYLRGKFPDDPELFDKLLPSYAPMVRRMVVDNGFYDALKRDNVELVTEGIDRITHGGILTKDGVERPFDLIVLGAGFKVSQYLWPVDYVGRDGATLQRSWEKDGARAYLGMVMPGFPNMFIFYGPNGQPRGSGFYSWAEIWARYIGGAVVAMIEGGHRSMEVKQPVFDDHNERLDALNKTLIWEAEGNGYYVNEYGRSAINMPWTTQDYYEMVRTVNMDDFDLG